jgi:diguanylate cyclase (GGDEF)-like protein
MTADHVTGLAPRAALEAILAERLPGSGGLSLAVAICDLVGLKATNLKQGFRAGDARLAAAAATLRHVADGARLLARLGGDELVAVFVGPEAAAAADRTAARLAQEPRLRAAAATATADDTPDRFIDRLYAAMRPS